MLQRKVVWPEDRGPPAAGLRGADHGEGGVLFDVERPDRVDHERDMNHRGLP